MEQLVTPDDVVAYLNADYRLRAGFDPEVSEGHVFTAKTPIGSLGSKQLHHVLNAVSKIAPEVVPVPTIVHSARQRIGSWLVIIALLSAVVARLLDATLGAYILAGSGVLIGLLLNRGRPASVTLGRYATVGDLAAAAARSRAEA